MPVQQLSEAYDDAHGNHRCGRCGAMLTNSEWLTGDGMRCARCRAVLAEKRGLPTPVDILADSPTLKPIPPPDEIIRRARYWSRTQRAARFLYLDAIHDVNDLMTWLVCLVVIVVGAAVVAFVCYWLWFVGLYYAKEVPVWWTPPR